MGGLFFQARMIEINNVMHYNEEKTNDNTRKEENYYDPKITIRFLTM